MLKIFLSSSILIISNLLFCQSTEQFNFNVLRFKDSVRIESCIPLNLYNNRLDKPNGNDNSKKAIDGIPMHVIGSKWNNNCLIILWPEVSNIEIITYIKEFTTLREDQIIIVE